MVGTALTQTATALDGILRSYNEFTRPLLDTIHGVSNGLFYGALYLLAFVTTIYLLTTLYVTLRRKEPYRESALADKDAPYVTIQIPTRNELAAIRCAKHCLNFDYPKNKYEIHIGDDSDIAEVSEALAAFAAKHANVKIFKRASNDGYKAGNLNNMLPHAKGEHIVLFDSDFMPPADFLRRIVAPMVHDKRISGVQARWKFTNTEQNMISVLGASIVAVFHHVALPFFNRRRQLSVLCGSAEAVRKSVLVKMGKWRHGSLTEDIEYSLRLLTGGHRIQYLPDLECNSEVPYRPKDLYRQQMRWAYGVVSSLKVHGTALLTSKKMSIEDKFLVGYIFSGYTLTTSLIAVLLFGVIAIVTHQPEPINFSRFFLETARNVLLTSGLLITSGYSLWRIGSAKKFGLMLLSSFTYGVVVTYYVNRGIWRVIQGKEMPWYLLSKKGNDAT